MSAEEKIESYKKEIEAFSISNEEELEKYRLRFIGRKNVLGELFGEMRNVAPENRKSFGVSLNELKNLAEDKFKASVELFKGAKQVKKAAPVDLTLPPQDDEVGAVHPLTQIRARIIQIFERIGFSVADGPEIEDDFHNFTALNFPPNHPAREMQDTFFIKKGSKDGEEDIVLRTHTSNVQIRLMENQKPPIRAIMPGRVYRNEAISARAHCMFHQVEGIYINENVSFKDLKQTLYHFAKELFHKDIKIRFRPSFFPFTEPSAEMDISCLICHGEGCNICKYTGWVEILGSGMVDPNVLENCDIDSEKYTGFAFGMGIERIAQLKFQVNDLRLYTENDVRFLKQFSRITL
ncbi:MAG: phenylalanine--tRNA ligase subunit alpha [Bacteroidota bacterium]